LSKSFNFPIIIAIIIIIKIMKNRSSFSVNFPTYLYLCEKLIYSMIV